MLVHVIVSYYNSVDNNDTTMKLLVILLNIYV